MDADPDPTVTVDLLARHPDLVRPVGEMRWNEWGHPPEPTEVSYWVDVTRREAGTDTMPVTWVAFDAAGATGAVGIGEYDLDERREWSPWVYGMIVRSDLRGRGIGRALLRRLEEWAVRAGYPRVWVATGGPAIRFYERCGWEFVERVERPGADGYTVLIRVLTAAA